MSEHELFDSLRRLDGEPVTPRAAFADELRRRLMTELAAPEIGGEEQPRMDLSHERPHAPLPFPTGTRRRRSKVIPLLEIAAVAALLIGFAAFAYTSRFGSGGSDQPTTVPAAMQDEATPAETALQSEATPEAAMEALPASRPGILWELPLPEGESVDFGGMALHDGMIYRLLATPSFVGVEAVDAETGGVQWKTSHDWSGFGIAADDAGVYLISGQAVVAVDPANGDSLWSVETDTIPMTLTVADDVVYVWDGVATMTALDTATGASLWSGTASVGTSDSAATHAPVVGSSTVVAVAGSGSVIGFDLNTGTEAWSIGGFNPQQIDLALTPGDLLVINGNGAPHSEELPREHVMTVAAVTLADGTVLWEKTVYSTTSDVVVADSLVAVLDNPGAGVQVVMADDGQSGQAVEREGDLGPVERLQVYGLDLETGHTFYNPDNGLAIVSDQGLPSYSGLAPSVPNSDTVLAISESGRATAISMTDGQITGLVDLGGSVHGDLLSDESGVYATLLNGALVAAEPGPLTGAGAALPGEGAIDWTLPLADGELTGFGGMVAGDGLVYRLIETPAFRGIEAVYSPTGGTAWRVPVSWTERAPAADRNGVYAVDQDERLIALDPGTGTERWTVDFAGNPVVSMVSRDGLLYVWDESSTMTALDTATGATRWQSASGESGGPQRNENGSPIPAVSDEMVAMVDATGAISAFDRETGTLIWTVTPRAHGIDTRLVFQADRLFVLSANPDTPSAFVNAIALDAASGETLWLNGVEGPIAQPVAAEETNVYLIADAVHPGKNSPQTEIVLDPVDASSAPWIGADAAATDSSVGGHRVYAIDVTTGQVLWGQTSQAGEFVQLMPGCISYFCGLGAVTTDGHAVILDSSRGTIYGDAVRLGGDVLDVSSGSESFSSSFATLTDGALVAFGRIPFNEQG